MIIPNALLGSYLVSAMIMSLPLVAFGVFLNNDIKMPLDEQSRFYATIFLPWSFKPLYSYAMEHYPICGSRRRFYIITGNVGLGACFLLTALFATNTLEMYLLSFARSAFEALAECGYGLTLIDIVGKERVQGSDAAQLGQARTTTARMAGSLSSFVLGLLLYGCGGSTLRSLSSRTIIGMTSVLCLVQVGFAFALPEKRSGVVDTDFQEEEAAGETEPVSWTIRSRVLVALGALSFQFCFVWIGVQSLVSIIPWIIVFLLSILAVSFMGIIAMVRSRVPWVPIASAALMFIMHATPGYGSSWFSFKLYALNGSSCAMQILLVVGEIGSLTGSWLYPRLANMYLDSTITEKADKKMRAQQAMVFFTITACIAGMLDVFLAIDWEQYPYMDQISSGIRFGIVSLIGGFLGQLSQISRQVFVTEHSYDNKQLNSAITPGVLYGIYLSLIDFADSASGWITAPIMSALNLSYTNQSFSLLWVLVVIAMASNLLVVLLIPPALDMMGRWLATKQQVQYNVVGQGEQLLPSSAAGDVAVELQDDGRLARV